MKIFKLSIPFIVFLGLVFFQTRPLWANNLSITNVSLESRTATCDRVKVQFDISWSNSWSDATNRDGVWVFFKVCKNTCSEWKHGKMKTAGTNPADTSAGSGTSLTRYVPTDKAGAFLYRSATGSGTVTTTNIELALDFAAAPVSASATDTIKVRVFGIEMVYIPSGSFYLGPNNNLSGSISYFYNAGDTGDPRASIAIGSAKPYISELSGGKGTWGDISFLPGSWGPGSLPASRSQLNASFPTGYTAFWIMKYELTQAMYRDFLNTLTTAATATRTLVKTNNYFAMTNTAVPSCRNSIKFKSSGTPFVCDLSDNDVGDQANDGEWIAMNYLIWPDCAAFADWAGLRPLTEMEFEKAGHGSADPPGPRKACGIVGNCAAKKPLTNAGKNSEVASGTGSCHWAYMHSGGSTLDGPLRVGFAATSTSTRITACASPYGIMDMSGNVYEYMVSLAHPTGLGFRGSHGEGVLSTTSGYEGNATNTDWPGIDGTIARGVTGAAGSGARGGVWYAGGEFFGNIETRNCGAIEVSARTYAYVNSRGCRLGRTN